MKNITFSGRSLLLVVCAFLFFSAHLSAQSCNFNANNIDVTVDDTCIDSDPYVTINFNNFFLSGEAVIDYKPTYNGFLTIGGVDFTTGPVAVINGIVSFEVAEPRLAGFPDNFVVIEAISFSGFCSQNFIGNELVSNIYDFNQPSGLTITPVSQVDPPCSNIASGEVTFEFTPTTVNNTSGGFNDFNRFDVTIFPTLFGSITTLTPMTPAPSGTPNTFVVNSQNLVSGDYTFLINDLQEGCTTTHDVTIGGNFDVQAVVDNNATCFGNEDGQITINVLDGDPTANGPLTYTLSGPNGFSRNGAIVGQPGPNSTFVYPATVEANLPAGNYTIDLVATSGGCTASTTTVVTQFDEIIVAGIAASTICGDAIEYELNLDGIEGVGTNGQFRILDSTRVDMIGGSTNCFTDPNGFTTLSSIDNLDGTFTYLVPVDPAGCFDIEQDTTVSIYLELRNQQTGCRDTFRYELQIDAQPEAPSAMAFAVTAANDTLVSALCSRQEYEIFVEDYDPAFQYEVFFTGTTAGLNIDTLGGFATADTLEYTGAGSVTGAFGNNNNGARTIEFGLAKINPTTGCISEIETFDLDVRPEPVITDPMLDIDVQVCSDEVFRIRPEINGNNNANITFDYVWSVSPDLEMVQGDMFGNDLASEDLVRGRFVNLTNVAQTATLTITPKLNQNSQLIGGGLVNNDCSGESRVITLTVTPQPTLSYSLAVGDEVLTLNSGDVLAAEICSGEDFILNNLAFGQANGTNQNMFVNYQVFGDARFLAIPASANGTDLDDLQVDENVSISTFLIGLNNIMNNEPNNNAQVARIVLTPYFESDPANPTDFPACAGEPIDLFITLNPVPPQLPSPQTTSVCSGDPVAYTIANASGNGGNLETRITEVELFTTTNEFVVPAGADRIENFSFEIAGANGGSSANARGGYGGQISGGLSEMELLPGDTVRVNIGTAGADGASSGDGGDGTIMVVIAGPNSSASEGTEIYRFVAGGGGGAGQAMAGGDVPGLSGNNSTDDGIQGQGQGGFGGTGYPDATGGAALNNGGGGGGGYAGGNGGVTQTGAGGEAGTSFVFDNGSTTLTALPIAATNDEFDQAQARIVYTVVYDDIRFNPVSVDIPAGLVSVGEDIFDNDGEVDTILFGQQFINETNAPIDVTYVFSTTTEANCDDNSQVEVVLTVEPEPTGFLLDGDSDLTEVVTDSIYSLTICSRDGFDAILSSNTVPSGGATDVYFRVNTEITSVSPQVGFFGSTAGTAHALPARYFLSTPQLPFFENDIFNNSGEDATITYTITPYFRFGDNGTADDCEGEPFVLIVTVQPGFPNGQIQAPATVFGCSEDVFGEDLLFDFEDSQNGLNVDFTDVRLVGYATDAPITGFTALTGVGVDTTGLSNGGLLIGTDAFENDSYRNLTGGLVTVTYSVRLVSEDGCESNVINYSFGIRAEPVIDVTNASYAICEGDLVDLEVSPAANSAFVNNFGSPNVTFDYFIEFSDSDLTYFGTNVYPVLNGDSDEAENDEFVNNTDEPQLVTYKIVPESQFGCVGDTAVFEITILPRPQINAVATQAPNAVPATTFAAADTLTICSGSAVNFELDQPVTGVGVFTRINRVAPGIVTDENGDPLAAFQSNQPIADFSEILVNTGTAPEVVRYSFRAYNIGGNNLDEGGNGDDCLGDPVFVYVEVLPAATDPATLTFNYSVANAFVSQGPESDTLCSGTSIGIRPATTIDPTETGVAFAWSQTNDGSLPTNGGFGGFDTPQGNLFFTNLNERIEATLTNTTLSGVTFTYQVQLYTFGANGIDDELEAGSDDCAGTIETFTVFVEPSPVLSAQITAGSVTETISSSDNLYFYELCSGDDFSLGGLTFNTNDVIGRVKYVEFEIEGADALEFLNIDDTGNSPLALDITGFLIGQSGVQNTTNAPYSASITLTPYYEDDVANPGLSGDCAGESINISVILNPEVTGVPTPQDVTICSGSPLDYEIMNGANTVTSFVTGSYDFSAGTDFVVPDNVADISIVNFSLTSADGGDATLNMQDGARGIAANGEITGSVLPGDTIRAIYGQPGADGATAGNGGGGSALLVVGGPLRVNPGNLVHRLVLGGGGGAGTSEDGTANLTLNSSGGSTPGGTGGGSGGNGGEGFPGLTGGSSSNTGGGGGGGWIGGDGGDSFSGSAGQSGTGFISGGFSLNSPVAIKDAGESAGSAISMDFILEYDDVVFTITDKEVPTDPNFDASMAQLPIGTTGLADLLNGETFVNNTDLPQVVTYTLSSGTEAACPGGEVIVNVTVEPRPMLQLSSAGTMISGNAEDGFTTTICSSDSLSAILSSNTIPTGGANDVRVRVIDVDLTNGPNLIIGGNTGNDNASAANGNFGGNNRPSAADIPFYEGEIVNTGTTIETVAYTVVSFINVGGAPNCAGDTITVTVSVQPGFDGIITNPAQFSLCSNVSLADAGFDVDATQTGIQIPFDTIIVDTVQLTPAAPGPLFEVVNSAYSGTPTELFRSSGFFGQEVYRNRTGAPVVVSYRVRLISEPGCPSQEIIYNFRYTAEPVIDNVASATNQLDTVVCNNEPIDLSFNLAPNSAFFANPVNVVYNITQTLPSGLVQSAGGVTYPATGVSADAIELDEYTNSTDAPLDVVYTVTPSNNSCLGDPVTYTATILPDPTAEVTLTVMDSTATYNLDNSAVNLPNPVFGLCSGQALEVEVTDESVADQGVHLAEVRFTGLDALVTGADPVINFTSEVADLGDSLSFEMGELVNQTSGVLTFTIRYRTYFERNGVNNVQLNDGDCRGTFIEFDVEVNPANIARIDVREPDDAVITPIPSGQDTLCSGDLYDLAVRTASTIPNDPNLPAIDNYLVEVIAPMGMEAVGNTSSEDFTVEPIFDNPDFYFTRLNDLSWINTSPGIKTVTYIATPYSNGCAGIADTTTISFRPEISLELDVPAVCISGEYPITAVDQNQASSTTNNDYDWRYLGGDADFFSIKRGDGTGEVFVLPNTTPPLNFNNTRFLRVTAFPNTTPGDAIFRISYMNDAGCTTVDTLTLAIGTEVSAGIFDTNVPIQCEGNTPIILDDYLDDADPGGSWTQVGGPQVGTFNAAAGSFLANNLGGGGALLEFEFRYVIGDGASGCTPDSTDITVEVQSDIFAGTYTGTPIEACQSAPVVNLFDGLIGEETGGVFVQIGGTDNVVVDGADGIFDQTGVTPGTYVYRYEVAGRNGCPGDDETVVVNVVAQANCSEPVPCDVINLTAGFNLISFDVIPNDNSVEAIFADLIANQNLVQIVSIQADVNSGIPQTFSYLSILDAYVGEITNGIQGGYGYIVQVLSPATIEVCGTAADPDFRVPLQAGLNIVGYVPQTQEAVDLYFDDIIATNDLNLVRTVENGFIQDRIYNVFPFPVGPLVNMTNGKGYLIDVSMAYPVNSWRELVNYIPTSSFDQFNGFVSGSDDYAGETMYFTDIQGNVYGQAIIGEDGLFYHAFAFGDLESTDLVEGYSQGDRIYVSIQGEIYQTGMFFDGGWASRRFDLELGEVVSSTSTIAEATSRINIYPNPTSGMINLEVETQETIAMAKLEVFNTLGQMVFTQALEGLLIGKQNISVDLSRLTAGTYQLRLVTNQGVIGQQQLIRR